MKAMTLRLPDEVHEALRQRAFGQRTSITEIVRQAIDERLTWIDAESSSWCADCRFEEGDNPACCAALAAVPAGTPSEDEVLVEGSWFKRTDLPEVLGNFMRSSAEHAREAKDLLVALTELRPVREADTIALAARTLPETEEWEYMTVISHPIFEPGTKVRRTAARFPGPWLPIPEGSADIEEATDAVVMLADLANRLVAALAAVTADTAPPAYLALDLWMALGAPVGEFDAYYERNGWANSWSNLLGEVRKVFRPRCGQDADGEPCVLTEGHGNSPHYGASDVGASEPIPTAVPADVETEQWKQTDEVRIHYSFGVNSGRRTGTDRPGAVEQLVAGVERDTQGPVNLDKVERRTRFERETPWLPIPESEGHR